MGGIIFKKKMGLICVRATTIFVGIQRVRRIEGARYYA